MNFSEYIVRLRKAPQRVKERVIAVVTIASLFVITAVWFAFSVPRFLESPHVITVSSEATSTSANEAAAAASFELPFSGVGN